MKKLTVCVILALICTGAQARNKTFDNLAKIKDVECVHINKMLLKLASMKGEDLHIGESINIGKDTFNKIKDIKIYTTDNLESVNQMKEVVLNHIKGKDWEPLVDVKDEDGEVVKIYQAKKGKKVTNIIFALDEDEASLVVLDGTLDIAQLMEMEQNGDND
ncbi:MAG: DUF4252 domain-containing protein [Prevotella sp.]|nr:DUF4252 domain-containing protein [Prevotella sp.]